MLPTPRATKSNVLRHRESRLSSRVQSTFFRRRSWFPKLVIFWHSIFFGSARKTLPSLSRPEYPPTSASLHSYNATALLHFSKWNFPSTFLQGKMSPLAFHLHLPWVITTNKTKAFSASNSQSRCKPCAIPGERRYSNTAPTLLHSHPVHTQVGKLKMRIPYFRFQKGFPVLGKRVL